MFLPNNSDQIPYEIIQNGYNKLFRQYDELSPISSNVKDEIRTHSIAVLYKPKSVILDYGQQCNYCLFCISGLVKSVFNDHGKEGIVWFMGPGEPIIAVDSWFEQNSSDEKLIAIKETICIAVSKQVADRLSRTRIDFANLYLKLISIHFQRVIKRTKWQQYTKAEIFEDFKLMFPNIMKTVPKRDLAKFLGIGRQTFDRLLHKSNESGEKSSS